jgi:hypothetical protein
MGNKLEKHLMNNEEFIKYFDSMLEGIPICNCFDFEHTKLHDEQQSVLETKENDVSEITTDTLKGEIHGRR